MDKQEAINRLHQELKRGDRVYTILRRVNPSGTVRDISLIVIDYKSDGLLKLDVWAAAALGWKLATDARGIVTHGVGMDMGFHLVSRLSAELFNGDEQALRQSWL